MILVQKVLALKHLHKNTSDFGSDCHNLKFGWYRKSFEKMAEFGRSY